MAHAAWGQTPRLDGLLDHGVTTARLALTLFGPKLVAQGLDPRRAARRRDGRDLIRRGRNNDRHRFGLGAQVQDAAVDPLVEVERAALRIVVVNPERVRRVLRLTWQIEQGGGVELGLVEAVAAAD